jgi:hypothetical protein
MLVFSLGNFLKSLLFIINAIVILNEDRFLSRGKFLFLTLTLNGVCHNGDDLVEGKGSYG